MASSTSMPLHWNRIHKALIFSDQGAIGESAREKKKRGKRKEHGIERRKVTKREHAFQHSLMTHRNASPPGFANQMLCVRCSRALEDGRRSDERDMGNGETQESIWWERGEERSGGGVGGVVQHKRRGECRALWNILEHYVDMSMMTL